MVFKKRISHEFSTKREAEDLQRPAVGGRILQKFDEKFEMHDSKWPTREVPEIVEEAEKRTKNRPRPSPRENTPP